MNTNYFLKQSTKKIIFLILILPALIQLILINLVQKIQDERIYYLTFVLFWLLYFPFFYWLNIVVDLLYVHSNKFFKLKLKKFKFSLVINFITMLNFVLFIAYIFSFIFFKRGRPNDDLMIYFALIQFIGVISFIYTNYFISKLIATIELKRKVNFSDISAYFIPLSFPPRTVWVIHNKVRRIQLSDRLGMSNV